ncbi:hypothetical protein ACH5RR_031522 [Cinchona calisaya]|uniref:Uncharacterized protein n=1 Tax=Cinchona calisaya TaxID=153742 RepID=A0ABD2YJS0_9GENT
MADLCYFYGLMGLTWKKCKKDKIEVGKKKEPQFEPSLMSIFFGNPKGKFIDPTATPARVDRNEDTANQIVNQEAQSGEAVIGTSEGSKNIPQLD